MLPPITEEDREPMARQIRALVRLRRRAANHGRDTVYLTDAINALYAYGELQSWWKGRLDDSAF